MGAGPGTFVPRMLDSQYAKHLYLTVCFWSVYRLVFLSTCNAERSLEHETVTPPT